MLHNDNHDCSQLHCMLSAAFLEHFMIQNSVSVPKRVAPVANKAYLAKHHRVVQAVPTKRLCRFCRRARPITPAGGPEFGHHVPAYRYISPRLSPSERCLELDWSLVSWS